ncbi:MAG TPA: ATP-binding protein [Ramlibacter sp.]|uniref:trifunctional serine/threonine-protein kinase/ATP-binding protein/sensor histidine kinase n=1 Tax=Ramlibacter sp. TaxID=1917967 RepID=UPI002B824C6C|nr:ATP-binding protein [Ramlibacter sp.]HVZ44816.1 ATP-binding protein [Ramlibacter sp.]
MHPTLHPTIDPTLLSLAESALAATQCLRHAHGRTHAPQPLAALPWLAPELTGRTAHGADRRADLYALGAVLYDWATGRAAFAQDDPLAALHERLTFAPVPPSVVRPELPGAFSDIVMRLLEKEPARRYQSAEGLAHDLRRLRRALARGGATDFALGRLDFGDRLAAPCHPVGRDGELERLRGAFDAASDGATRVVLVAGAAGVGKTALVDAVRRVVESRDGSLFVGRAAKGGAGTCALRQALGLPQSAAQPAALAADLLRAAASPGRPVVLVLEDLHWNADAAIDLIDRVLCDEDPPGLLVIGTCRDDELVPPHPLAVAIDRWSGSRPRFELLRLANLKSPDLARMLGEMLRLPADSSEELARALSVRCGGNPRDTVELVNALRRDGVLRPGAHGWRWDAREIERHANGASMTDLLRERVSRLPRAARELLEALACLGGDVPMPALGAATGLGSRELHARCARLEAEGMVLLDPGPAARLRLHEPVRRAACASADAGRRMQMHLDFARRLAAVAAFELEAAGQYLSAACAVTDAEECAAAGTLMHRAATRLASHADFAGAEPLLRGALGLLGRAAANGKDTAASQLRCELDLHAALSRLGRTDEAAELYAWIELRDPDPLVLADAALTHAESLHAREADARAITHGARFLRGLGFETQEHLGAADAAAAAEALRGWVETFDDAHEAAQPEARDACVIAAADMLAQLALSAQALHDGARCAIVRASLDLWHRHGPCPGLAASLSMAGSSVAIARADWRTGYLAARRMIALCDAKQWQAAGLHARQRFALAGVHWFEPLERGLQLATEACEGLLARGRTQAACSSYWVTVPGLQECAATVQEWARQADAGLGLAERNGMKELAAALLAPRQLARALRGETSATGSFDDAEFAEARHLAGHAARPRATFMFHVHRALGAAIFADTPALYAHAKASLALSAGQGTYTVAWAHWLAALAAAWKLQDTRLHAPQRDGMWKADLAERAAWLELRAIDAPANFRHICLHVLAEQAWAQGDDTAAATRFDAALGLCATGTRPWHRAFITERAGQFHRARGRASRGGELLAEAHRLYTQWGATAKAAQLVARDRVPLAPDSASWCAADASRMDTLAVLRTARVLQREGDAAALDARVREVLRRVSGATKVTLVRRDPDANDWVLPAEDGLSPGCEESVGDRAPVSVLAHAMAQAVPLLIDDALADERFAGDPYFRDMARCSLMAVPVVHQAAVRAMLVLENDARSGAFGTECLDAVVLIAGQLAMSLENARLYERLERKVEERARQLREAQSHLLAEARRAGMAQIAANVLHNVGNVLTSMNVSAHMLEARVRDSSASRLTRLSQLLQDEADDLPAFFAPGAKGRLVPAYLRQLDEALASERDQMLAELQRLCGSVEHIRNVVAMQEAYAGDGRVLELARIDELADEALRPHEADLARDGVAVRRDYAPMEATRLDKARVMHILSHLFANAREAMLGVDGERRLTVTLREEIDRIVVTVRDTGCGIARENLDRIFSHGFTTKPDSHGFGLHSCVIAAQELGGSLTAFSDGPGKGAKFALQLPLA